MFQKGQSGNPSGRPKGSQGKRSTQQKAWINDFLDKKHKDFMRAFDRLEDRDKCYIYEKMLRYIIPPAKPQEIDFSQLTDYQLDFLVERLANRFQETIDNI